MHPLDAFADPLAFLLTLGLVGWVGWTLWRAQRLVRAERLGGLRRERQRLDALKRASGPRVLP